ncbi:MAG: hypothetical protein AB7S57_19550 [Acetobacteraceae bacterium]
MPINQYNWSKHDLADPGTYYGGFKEGRLVDAGVFRRSVSDRRGEVITSDFQIVISDLYGVSTSRLMRGKLAGVTSKYIINKTVVARTVTDEDRRALLIPRTIGVGLIRNYAPEPGMKFSLQCKDYLAKFTGLETDERQIPKRTLSRDDFADLPNEQVGAPVPIIYGDCSSQASATAPPVLALDPADGAGYADWFGIGIPFWITGYGPTGVLSAPTGVSAVEAGGGSLIRGKVPSDTFFVLVTAINGSGGESDPHTFTLAGAAAVTLTGDNKKIDVSWSAVGGATAYRVYMGYSFIDTGATQYIQTAGLSCSFTADPGYGTAATAGNITPGANLPIFSQTWVYAVSALMADGETVISQPCMGRSLPYRRPVRVEWTAVPGALAYYVYRRNAKTKGVTPGATETAEWDRRWTVSSAVTFFDDDLLDTGVTMVTGTGAVNGAVPLIPCGMAAALDGSIWHRFLVAGHAVKEISGLFVEGGRVDASAYGVYAAVPGQTGYSTYFANTGNPQYTDINGRRYTFIYGRGQTSADVHSGKLKASVNVKGIETAGDGTGTLITDLFDQYLHFMRNFGFGDYQNGAWATSGPTWPDVTPALETLSDFAFQEARERAELRITGGYVGGGVIGGEGERETLRAVLRKWNLSCDAYSGVDHGGKYAVWLLPDTIAAAATAQHYTQTRDVLAGTFKVRDVIEALENYVPYTYGRDYSRGNWRGGEEFVDDATSITNYGETKKAELLELHFVRTLAIAADIAQRRLTRNKVPPRMVEWETGLYGMNDDLGNVCTMTHAEGIGAAGYDRQPLFIMRHEFDANRMVVRLEAMDIARLFSGAFILGDESALAASWALAPAADREYGYLADETTEAFSDGEPIKRLR